MNIGECPHADCKCVLALEVPARTPAYAIVQCDHCGRDVWYRFSRVDPEAWTPEQFEAEHIIDDAAKTITKRTARDTMTWTLIFCDRSFNSPQGHVVTGDPMAAAEKIRSENPYMADYVLIAAVEGRPEMMLRDDAKSLDEWVLL